MSKPLVFVWGFVFGLTLGVLGAPVVAPVIRTALFRDPRPGEWRRIGDAIATSSTDTYPREVEARAALVVECREGELAPRVLEAPDVPVSLEGGVFAFERGAVRGRFVLDQEALTEFREDCRP